MGKNRPDNRSGEKLKKALRQWHLPFLNAVQVSLEEDEGYYELESELELTRKPLRIDAFVLKSEDAYEMKSSLGRLLRKYNIFEYKGYGDYLSIGDYYKGLACAFLYKSEGSLGKKHGQIFIKEMSLIFVCFSYPKKLMNHLHKIFFVEEREPGIYEVHGERIAICILIQSQLASDKFLWLKNLSDCVRAEDFALMAEQAHREPMNHRKDELFQFIGENNEQLWKGDLAMCKIFEEIEQRGEERLANLIQFLLKEHRYEEIALVSRDSGKRREFYQRYGI